WRDACCGNFASVCPVYYFGAKRRLREKTAAIISTVCQSMMRLYLKIRMISRHRKPGLRH
ncbi:hypothetical protein M514_24147, partial [Trichuris suis]